MSASAFMTLPLVLMRRRAIAMATFSLPWKYLLAMSEFISIFTSGSQSTSSVHSQTRLLPSLLSSAAVMFTTRSRSGNSKRCGVSASRSFGPMSGSVLIISKTRSMTSRNSFAFLGLPIWLASLNERAASPHEVLVDHPLDLLAHLLGQLEHERAVIRGVLAVAVGRDRLAELDAPARRERDRSERAEQRERGRDREVRGADRARRESRLRHLRIDLLAADHGDGDDRRARAQRDLDEAAAPEALQPVALGERLARSLRALGEDGHELVLLQQPRRV